ncbi:MULTISPECIES: AtpZ/AtpI family protein [unclassified Sulfurimonas]|uniref:AtpZ/AtpI family protein n=1 Tax=unclassified Sulfurimonas TaxID=2623549 RepID=UPI003204C8A0
MSDDTQDKVNSEARENAPGQRKPRIKPIVEAADSLSLGISMVVAVLLGVGIGWLLKRWTGIEWLFWVGVFIGVAAAILNIYKAYSKQYKEFEKLAKEDRYAIKKQLEDDEDEDYGEKNY